MEEKSYKSTHPLDHIGLVTGSLYPYFSLSKPIFNIKVKGVYIVGIDIFLLTFRVGDTELSCSSVMDRLLLNASRLILYELGNHNVIYIISY
jgi:hypothetical protein